MAEVSLPQHAPMGVVIREGDRVLCHLCGRWFRSVIAHLPSHGWDHLAYRQAFGLERGQSLEGTATRGRRAAAMRARRTADPRLRVGYEQGQDWLRSGALTKAAAEAARGRKQPAQRRQKTLRTLASISPKARAEGSRRHAVERLRRTAHKPPPSGSDTPRSAIWSGSGSRRGRASPRSAGKRACTRTGSAVTWPASIRTRQEPSRRSPHASAWTRRGCRRSVNSASPTSPVTSATGTYDGTTRSA